MNHLTAFSAVVVMLLGSAYGAAVNPCPEVPCTTLCTHGYQRDAYGCATCKCVDPCEDTFCPDGEICIQVPLLCAAPYACPLLALCIPVCPKLICPLLLICKNGFVLDANKCQTCECLILPPELTQGLLGPILGGAGGAPGIPGLPLGK